MCYQKNSYQFMRYQKKRKSICRSLFSNAKTNIMTDQRSIFEAQITANFSNFYDFPQSFEGPNEKLKEVALEFIASIDDASLSNRHISRHIAMFLTHLESARDSIGKANTFANADTLARTQAHRDISSSKRGLII